MLKKLNEEIKQALKSQNKLRLMTLRMVKSQIEEEGKKKGPRRTDVDVSISYCKKLEKSLEIKNLPQDFIDKTKQEIEIIKEFLPIDLNFEEAFKIAKESLGFGDTGLIVAEIKRRAINMGKICSGRIAFLATKEALEKKKEEEVNNELK